MRLYTHQDHYSGGAINSGDIAQDVMEYSVWGSQDGDHFELISDVIAYNLVGEGPGLPTYTFRGTPPSVVYRGGSAEFGIINADTREYVFPVPCRYYGIRTSQISLNANDADPEIDAVAGFNITDRPFGTPGRPPLLVIFSPANNSTLPAGSTQLVTGFSTAPTTMNGVSVEALDAAGNLFNHITIRSGQNVFQFVATDAPNQSTTNTLTIFGTTCPQNFSSLGVVNASVQPEYGRTSFNEWTKTRYADLALRNVGNYSSRAPFYVGVTRISDPSVRLLAADGVSADGIPYYDFTATLTNAAGCGSPSPGGEGPGEGERFLCPNQTSLPRTLAFHNPNHVQFTYDLVVLGQTLQLAYNVSGQLTQVVNNAGFRTTVTRDSQGRVASLTDAVGNTTAFDYTGGCSCGRPGKVINPDGSFRLYEYNSQGQTHRVVNELGAETVFSYDDAGKWLWMRDPLTNYTQFFYNGPLLTNVVDALGRSTRYGYDNLNRTNKIIDGEGGVTEFRYDNNGNRTHVIDAVSNDTTFVYDAGNRLVQQIDPLGHTNFFAYDPAGNRTEATDRNGRRRTFAYDSLNRMTNELWWEGTSVVRSIVFGFNELGVQTLAEDPAARYEYRYDALNRLERVLAQSAGVPDFTLLYTYTALGQVESVTDNWGVRVGSGYDNRNRLGSRTWQGPGVDPARVDFAYDATGNRTRADRYADLAGANRVGFTTNAYNRAGVVTNITHLGPAGEVLVKYGYTLDPAYQIRQWSINNQLSTFNYDSTGQLTNALNTAQPNENFRYDANGNRVGTQSGGNYLVGRNNQILSDGTNRYAYDSEGNRVSRSNTVTGVLTTYQFDHRNRLARVLDRNPSGAVTQTVVFVYDAMNRRLSKTVNGQQNTNVVRFLYNQDDSWADLDGSNAVTARYLHGASIDELLARQRVSDGRGWYLTDHLGTVRDIANAASVLVTHVDYSSFGQVLAVSNPAALDRFQFTGRECDGETGLYFYRARTYSPSLGRFVSQDPIGFSANDSNLYRYAKNGPVLFNDPDGKIALIAIVAILAVAFTAIQIGEYEYCFGEHVPPEVAAGLLAVNFVAIAIAGPIISAFLFASILLIPIYDTVVGCPRR